MFTFKVFVFPKLYYLCLNGLAGSWTLETTHVGEALSGKIVKILLENPACSPSSYGSRIAYAYAYAHAHYWYLEGVLPTLTYSPIVYSFPQLSSSTPYHCSSKPSHPQHCSQT